MFYVVDQNGQYINEFNTREQAQKYCDRWNNYFRFNEWNEPIAHVVSAE